MIKVNVINIIDMINNNKHDSVYVIKVVNMINCNKHDLGIHHKHNAHDKLH